MQTNLNVFILQHSTVAGSTDPAMVDMVFFKLKLRNNPSADELRALLATHRGDLGIERLDLFDGREHSYIEIGAWLGDQGRAMLLMGLGKALGLWELLTPMSMLGLKLDDPMVLQMASMGYLTIKATP